MQPLKIKLSNRLSISQAKNTVLVAFMLGILLSAVQITLDFIKEQRQMDSVVLQVISMLRDAAAKSVYDIDEQFAGNVISGLFEYQPIRNVKIINDFGGVLQERARPAFEYPNYIFNRFIRMLFAADKLYTIPLYVKDRERPIGHILVSVDAYLVAENFITRSGLVILSGLIRNIALAVVLTLLFYFTLTKPLLRMIQTISAVDISRPASALLSFPRRHAQNEFGLLISTINFVLTGFAEGLKERDQAEEALRKSEMKYRTIFENSISGIFQVSPDGRFLTANSSMARICGYASPRELMESTANAAKTLVKEPAKRSEFQALITEQGAVKDFEFALLRKDSSVITAVINAHGVKDENGRLLYYEGVLEDITQRKQGEELIRKLNKDLEQRVLERTAELEAANRELEAFSYSVSHDLRSPLRSLDGFSQALLEDYQDRLDHQGRDYLQRVRNASQKMGHLIDDILNLAMVTRYKMKRETVDLSAMALAILEELKEKNPERSVTVTVADGLRADGDKVLIRVMLENLLGNAWKYTARIENPRIEFGMDRQNDEPVFFLRDNGAGFSMQYVHKLFIAFNRLHTTEQFEGTGIGLAIVQRVMTRHGGRVWAEGKEGAGATFYFTLHTGRRDDD